ncbi:hypothetical protein [Andreprevotia chitinilytica]|uniref:hypothetical protein n=1 Tax=Andreprevotia chitinilytica TaxID=396808 RepID=UPI00054D3024|nr:hypothetical protein [Andreprevotia chitinilytica]
MGTRKSGLGYVFWGFNMLAGTLIGCGDRHSDSALAAQGEILLRNDWGPTCEALEGLQAEEVIRGRLSTDFRPAFVVGYRFTCKNKLLGDQRVQLFYGWAYNPSTTKAECTHSSKDRSHLADAKAWHACGGGFERIS